ncbi:MAG: hypothetical protein J2P43_01205 [Candidatus Dormibacteraeota bacterium]|nr:hypothetical protein [Candidatus Dormibacteraeota bacterium]
MKRHIGQVLLEQWPHDENLLIDIEEGEILADVMVLGRGIEMSRPGWASLFVQCNDGQDTIVQLGLLEAAHQRTQSGWIEAEDE